jgi:hypothetical protein
MPSDIFYGAESEVRFGRMADATTDPTTWYRMPFVSATFNGQREQRKRPLLNTARNNALDPQATQQGLYRLSGDLVVPADTREFARFMWLLFGNPVTAAVAGDEDPALFTHAWASGVKTTSLFAAQVRLASNKVRIYRGCTGGSVGFDITGEKTKDFDVTLGFKGMREEDDSDFIGTAPGNLVPDAPLLRTVVKIDGTDAASRALSARWSWDRALQEDIFLSAAPNISGHSPKETVLQGQATFRAVGAVYDDLEAADDSFDLTMGGIGAVSGHAIDFRHEAVKFSRPPVAFNGPAEVERSWSWEGAQTASLPAAKVTVTNDVTSYT